MSAGTHLGTAAHLPGAQLINPLDDALAVVPRQPALEGHRHTVLRCEGEHGGPCAGRLISHCRGDGGDGRRAVDCEDAGVLHYEACAPCGGGSS